MNAKAKLGTTLIAAAGATMLLAMTAHAHHSFAMYDMRATQVFTAVVERVDPQPNHLQIHFVPMNEARDGPLADADGEYDSWTVEMGGSAQMARQGVSVNSFPRGTVFSIALHPLRNGEPGGSREGAMFRCPDRMRPKPGMHCDSVEGHVVIGTGPLPSASDE